MDDVKLELGEHVKCSHLTNKTCVTIPLEPVSDEASGERVNIIQLNLKDWALSRLILGEKEKDRLCGRTIAMDELKALRASASASEVFPLTGDHFGNWRKKQRVLADSKPPQFVVVNFRGTEVTMEGSLNKVDPVRIVYKEEVLRKLLKVLGAPQMQHRSKVIYLAIATVITSSLTRSIFTAGYSRGRIILLAISSFEMSYCVCGSNLIYVHGIRALSVGGVSRRRSRLGYSHNALRVWCLKFQSMYLGSLGRLFGSQALKEDTLETPPKKKKCRSRGLSAVDDTDDGDEPTSPTLDESHPEAARTKPSP